MSEIARPVPGRSGGRPARPTVVRLLAAALVVLLVVALLFTGWYRVRLRAWPWPSSLPALTR